MQLVFELLLFGQGPLELGRQLALVLLDMRDDRDELFVVVEQLARVVLRLLHHPHHVRVSLGFFAQMRPRRSNVHDGRFAGSLSSLALLRQILATADHDRPFLRGGHITYGETVGAVPQNGMAARPRLFGFAESQFRLFGQYFRGTMATPMQRSAIW